ncbi:uncharacterized protein LOC144100043 [Amblyomma americanum]
MEGDDGRGFFLVDDVDIEADLDEDSTLPPALPAEPAEVQRQMQEGEVACVNNQWEKKPESKNEKSEEQLQEGAAVPAQTETPPVEPDTSHHDVATMADDGQMAYAMMMCMDQEGDRLPQETEVAGDQPTKEDKDEEKKDQE